jgi:cytochrome c biogenesis factor
MKYLFVLLLLLVLIGGGFAIWRPRGRGNRKYHFESTPARNLTTTELTIGATIVAVLAGVVMALGG